MKFLLKTVNCIKVAKECGWKYSTYSQIRHLFSKTGKWDESFPTVAVIKQAEAHWKQVFEAQQQQPDDGKVSEKKKKYILAMFPYPSGQLHMGHMRVYTISDTVARYYRAQGYQVIHPIGWDAFGLPAENAAIERGASPASWTDQNIANMKEQFKHLGCCFDWSRELRTCDPEYYRWTQDLFLRLHRAGLVYRKEAYVNWDPMDCTVLADEQVDQHGRAWRSGAVVERRLLYQWYIRVTSFSKALYDGLDQPQLKDWGSVISDQRQWIGPCDGYTVRLPLRHAGESSVERASFMPVYTAHPELLCGVSFIGVRSDHVLANGSMSQTLTHSQNVASGDVDPDVEKIEYKYSVLNTTAVNPFSEKTIPIVVCDGLPYINGVAEYYLGYGSGSELDKTISINCSFDVEHVIEGNNTIEYWIAQAAAIKSNQKPEKIQNSKKTNDAWFPTDSRPTPEEQQRDETSELVLRNSCFLDGLGPAAARRLALDRLAEGGFGAEPGSSSLGDWLISRQRYWGTPIPIIHCPSCGTVPVPAADLPVELPPLGGGGKDAPRAAGASTGLQHFKDWRQCLCPQCGGSAQRETDTMDTFVDSSWYFLRFLDPSNSSRAFDGETVDAAMPVDLYVGGMEHAVLHLYFARFFQHFLHSQQLSRHSEPFNRLLLVGRVKAPAYVRKSDGKYLPKASVDITVSPPVDRETGAAVTVVDEKMSKSKYNGVDPSEVIEQHSTDITRLGMLRGESPISNRAWREDALQPVVKMITLIWRTIGVFLAVREGSLDKPCTAGELQEARVRLATARNLAVHRVTRSIEETLQLNYCVMTMEIFVHDIRNVPLAAVREDEYERALSSLLVMLAPMAPHLCAEMWQAFRSQATLQGYRDGPVQEQRWPVTDEGYKLPVTLKCWVNFELVHNEKLCHDVVSEQQMLETALQQPQVLHSLQGLPTVDTSVEISETDATVLVNLYTMDRKQLAIKRNQDKALKKQRRKNKLKAEKGKKETS